MQRCIRVSVTQWVRVWPWSHTDLPSNQVLPLSSCTYKTCVTSLTAGFFNYKMEKNNRVYFL